MVFGFFSHLPSSTCLTTSKHEYLEVTVLRRVFQRSFIVRMHYHDRIM